MTLSFPVYNDVEITGPMIGTGRYFANIDGKRVPYIEVIDEGEDDKGAPMASIFLDGRMVFVMPVEQLPMMVELVAHAMAISNGFHCFGGQKVDLWGPR